ncbi:MAG: type II secretion system F family protein [Phycisphaerae bacterium]|nr:type II secretion system F family protein [Phycisphaerae bacterium]
MPVYQYQAMNAAGQELKESIEAPNTDEAVAKIRAKGLFLLKIKETSKGEKKKKKKDGAPAAAATPTARKSGMGRISVKQITQFTRQLSTLQDAGLPILRSLHILEQQQKPGTLKNILHNVGEDVESGSTLSEAMERNPKAFDRLYTNMVAAGEAGGVLDVILQRLAEFMEKAQALKRQVVGAMIYPAVVITFAVGIVSGIMIVVVPKFKEIFSDFGSSLPGPTILLMDISDWFIVSGGWVVVLITPPSVMMMLGRMRRSDNARSGAMEILKYIIMVMSVGVFFVLCAGLLIYLGMIETPFQQAGAGILTTWGSAQLYALYVVVPICALAALLGMGKGGIGYGIDKMLLNIPVIGAILSKTSIARFSRTLGTLISAGVPILEALTITKETSGNRVYGYALGLVHDSIRQGESFAGPLKQTKVCDGLVVNMIDVGEETGDLDKMLMKVADNYDEEVEALVGGLVSLLEPIMVIFLGTVVGFIVIALFLPLVTLINSVSGGG